MVEVFVIRDNLRYHTKFAKEVRFPKQLEKKREAQDCKMACEKKLTKKQVLIHDDYLLDKEIKSELKKKKLKRKDL